MKGFFHDISGSITVEAVLVLPIFVTLALGTMDGAYLLWQSHRMETQLALAGNYLSKTRTPTSYEADAKRLAVRGRLSSGHDVLIENWTEQDVSVSYRTVANTANNDGYDYRGGDNIRIVILSSQISYSGFGVLSSVSNGAIFLRAEHEERIVGDDQA